MAVTAIPEFARARVLVAGDVMLDRYWQGPTSRISPEAPVQVVRIQKDECRPGGAANVALNIAALGGRVQVLGVVGPDEAAQKLRDSLAASCVHADFLETAGQPTITKLRVMSRNQQLIRLDFEESLAEVGAFDRGAYIVRFNLALVDAQVVILSDYGKGTLADTPKLIALTRAAGKPVLVDPKGSDWGRYRGATLVTPNQSELEAVVGSCSDQQALISKGMRLLDELKIEALLVTQSENGMTLLASGFAPLHLPAEALEVYDVTGAGDTVIATVGAAIAAGHDLPHSARVANIAAGIVVGKLGTATASPSELARAIRRGHENDGGILSESELVERVALARAQGQIVVMVAGRFDLLHVGHIRFLEAARKLGDVLVVAVYDDDSACEKNGAGRPLNSALDRMRLLASLKAVDWIVMLSENAPDSLINRVQPNLFATTDARQNSGGAMAASASEIAVLRFHSEYSSENISERVRSAALKAA